jgi:hypothetical protein
MGGKQPAAKTELCIYICLAKLVKRDETGIFFRPNFGSNRRPTTLRRDKRRRIGRGK